ncbi:hypothetical protein JB92DRAFT_2938277 [Gautieria morchelliformis]|nr:hypothetical protein JB92DRAFT_2938277 [Gautieria morchelliformis]
MAAPSTLTAPWSWWMRLHPCFLLVPLHNCFYGMPSRTRARNETTLPTVTISDDTQTHDFHRLMALGAGCAIRLTVVAVVSTRLSPASARPAPSNLAKVGQGWRPPLFPKGQNVTLVLRDRNYFTIVPLFWRYGSEIVNPTAVRRSRFRTRRPTFYIHEILLVLLLLLMLFIFPVTSGSPWLKHSYGQIFVQRQPPMQIVVATGYCRVLPV